MPRTVVAALIFSGGRLLICQRSAAGQFPGQWEFPGGKVEPGEAPLAALRRELEEELGIAAEIGEEVWRTEHQYPGRAPVELRFYLVGRYTGTIENRVFQQVRWELPQQLLQYDFLEGDRPLIGKLATAEIVLPVGGDLASLIGPCG